MSEPKASEPTTITAAAAALRAGTVSAVELTTAALERADALEPELGCFLARFDESALAAAARADRDFAAGVDRGPLQGIPLGIKDLLATEEGPTTAHSRVPNQVAPPGVDAPAVARLRQQGGVIMGKASLSEFAFGAPDPDAGLPLPRNPWDAEHWPGGSSSGTGAGIAARLFLGGLGSDTGGSIRIPAACCGITGLKPTYGRVPKSRCVPLAWSLDTVGPMATSVEDCAVLLSAISGPDASDPTSTAGPPIEPLVEGSADLAGIRVGIERAHHGETAGAHPEVVQRVEEAVGVLEEAGATVEEVSLDHWDEAGAASLVVTHAEAFSYHRANLRDRWTEYGSGTRLLLAQGAFVTSADYLQAQRVRTLVQEEVRRLFQRVDVIVTPTIGLPVPRLDDDLVALMPLLFTGGWNFTGHPALSIPVAPVQGLPVGMQIAGRPFDESTVLRVGHAYQQVTDWHRRPATREPTS